MKHLIVSLTIGTCLLFSSAGVVFANDPHTMTSPTGQPGTGGAGASCSISTVTPGHTASNPNSPFGAPPPGKKYAGAGAGNSGVNSAHANSQYDVACFQQTIHQMP